MGAVFISYRRSDTAGYAGRLQDRLSARFGSDRVFRDIDTLQPGVDFVDAVDKAVASCSALVALIGRHWFQGTDDSGGWRIDELHDYPRMEINAALERGVLVIPVLVEGAVMPREEQLPEEIRKLARINALDISDSRWDYDVNRLIERLEPVLEEAPEEPPAEPSQEPGPEPAKETVVAPVAEGGDTAGKGPEPEPQTGGGTSRSGAGGRRRWRWAAIGGIAFLLLICGGSGALGVARRPPVNPVAFWIGILRPSPSPTQSPSPEASASESPSSSSSPGSSPSSGTSTGYTCATAPSSWFGAGTTVHSSDGRMPDIHVTSGRMTPTCVDGLASGSHTLRLYNDDSVNHNITISSFSINVSASPHTYVTVPSFSLGFLSPYYIRFYDGYFPTTLMGALFQK